MSDFVPPSGPPPPQLPAGWKAIWNDQYQAWFYANTVTKETTWEKPTEPAYPPGEAPPPGAPPSSLPPAYNHSSTPVQAPSEKSAAFGSNNPYGAASPAPTGESDEAMARRLQAEQNGGATGSRGHSDSYYGGGQPSQPSPSPYGQQNQLPPREEKRGLFSKISSKLSSSGSRPHQQQQYGHGGGYPQQGYGHHPQPMMGGGYPQQGYGGYPQQGMYGGPMGGPMYGGYPQQGGMYGPPRRQGGGGMGAGGGAALGLGAGMMGGMMMGGMMANSGDDYQDGYQDGMDDGGDMGGDDGGGE